MSIHGFNKLTLLDYPGRCAATIFLGGCNFRCPFCQNSGLILHPECEPVISEDTVLDFLKKRRGILDGVCITGGEPTLDPVLFPLIRKIKGLGYLVKLDTNGSHPETVKALISERLIDMVAMDIKSSKEHYAQVAGIAKPDLDEICRTVELLMRGSIPYEFRTTVVRELHAAEDFRAIGVWLAGADAYYLQAYKDSENVLNRSFHSYTYPELREIQAVLSKTITYVGIRGISE